MPPPGSRKPKELVAPPVFVRILPRNVGGHVEDGNENNVAKRLKEWRGSNTDGDGTKTKDNKPCVILSDTHGDTMYGFPKMCSAQGLQMPISSPTSQLHCFTNF